MKPAKDFKEKTLTLIGDDDTDDLHVAVVQWNDGSLTCISKWTLTDEDIETLKTTRTLWVCQMAPPNRQPPIMPTVQEPPFDSGKLVQRTLPEGTLN